MALFTSIPATLEAEQYLPGQQRNLPAGVHPASVQEEAPGAYVITAHGQRVYLEPGDWVAKEPEGDGYYPIKPSVFVKRWEAV